MSIEVGDNWTIDNDAHNWTATHYSTKVRKSDDPSHRKAWVKGDTYRTSEQTYHATLEQCCMKVMREDPKIAQGGVKDILIAIKTAEANILKALESVV